MSDPSNNLSALHINHDTCPTIGYQTASICVPVTVTPFVEVGETTTYCSGCPVIEPGTCSSCGIVNGSCSFTITQDICVAIPVVFGAEATVGDPSVECGDVSVMDISETTESDDDSEQ
jgi:hypothetical protein